MATDFSNWVPVGGTQGLQGWLDDGYANYLVEHSQQDGNGPPMSREQWAAAGTSGFNLPAGANLADYNTGFYSADGSQWDGRVGRDVTNAQTGESVYSQDWDAGGRWDLGDTLWRVGALFGGSALAAGAAGAAAGAGAGASGGAAAGGAGAAAGGASAAGLGAGAEGLTALGSAWSPQALGLTSLAPSTAAAEIAALSGALPGAVGAGAGIGELAMNGAIKGGLSGGGKALIQGENPLEGALKGAVGGAITGGIGGSVNAINPDGVGWVNSSISGGLNAAIGGGNPVVGAIGGGAGSLLGSLGQATQQPTVSAGGGNMDFGGVGDWFSNWTPDDLNITTDITGNVIPSNIGSDLWNPEWSSWVTDALSGLGGQSGDNSWLSSIIKGAAGGLGNVAGAVGGGQNLAALIGAGLGAASGGGTETSSRDPWSAAQPYLKNLLGDADAMRANLAANPYTPQQTQQYQQAFGGLDQARTALPGLLNWGQTAMQRQSTTPSYASLFGGGQPQPMQPQQPALLPQQPTAQAGGVGGLLGGAPEDRLKALMTQGRGLIG